MRIYITAPFEDEELVRALPDVTIIRGLNEAEKLATPRQLIDELKESRSDGIITELTPVTQEVLAEVPTLAFIGVCRGNPVNVDIPAASKARIPVFYTPGRNAIAVAEFTVGLILSVVRRIYEGDRLVRSREWKDLMLTWTRLQCNELAGKTVGLVGFGAVGRCTAKRLRGFDVRILGYDPFVPASVFMAEQVEPVSLEELLASSDIVSIHCAVTEQTRGLIGRKQISQMKRGAFLINTARAAIVDKEALIDALQSGQLAAAGLDVLDQEPPDDQDPLLDLPNTLVTPHIAGDTYEVVQHHSRIMIRNLKSFLSGEKPDYVANPEVLVTQR